MSTDAPLKLERSDDGKIARLILNRPETKNAISRQMLSLFHEHINKLQHEKRLTALVISSGVPKVFCSGADLKERATMKPEEVGPFVSSLRELIMKLYHFPSPTIAAIDGVALGGGLELSLACDIRLASSSSKVGLVETKLGIIPGGGGTQTLARVVGMAKAKELIFTGKVLSGEEAERVGLVNCVVPSASELEEKIQDMADQISSNGPIALRMAKSAVNVGCELPIETAMSVERNCYAQIIPTKDRLEGLLAFKEKRKPVFTGE